ncbi:MAG: thioredoxin family protein [Planctomycetota bacterium]
MHRPTRFSIPFRGLCLLAATLATVGVARGDLEWHGDLDAALAASARSGKPVLVVFEADWADATTPAAEGVLASTEVEAVVTACFEPVRLDVDAHADEARELGIERVPAACVLNAKRERLTSFECPPTPAEFVAAAARAAQVAAAVGQPSETSAVAAGEAAGDAFRGGPKRSGDATAAAVSSKVRQLADFAGGGAAGDSGDASRYAGSARSAFASAEAAPAAVEYRAPPATPTLARTPPGWPAEQPASSPTSFQPQAAAPPATPPASLPQAAGTTPWLAAQPAAPAAPATTATATDAVTAKPEAPAAAAKPSTNAFLAALQKPWSIFSKSEPKAVVEPAQPPTMPPALPQAQPIAAAQPAAAMPDTYGPMPLGLEGYCPVTVVERGSWVEGRPQWGARHRGRTYLFAGPEQQRAFLADPDRYAPALSGDDPVLAFEGGRSEPGRRAFGVTYQSRMYLFSSPETRATFTADPDRYTARVMIAEGVAPANGVRRF